MQYLTLNNGTVHIFMFSYIINYGQEGGDSHKSFTANRII